MRREVNTLLEKADSLSQEIARDIQEINQYLISCWELILADEGLALLD
ncbi:MAG: hypothetical protein GF365_02985 [Candidatus Buchananbacteria bacterium]|nr:hypothetical protein [Candidatus Buchananbacteria bacterium]